MSREQMDKVGDIAIKLRSLIKFMELSMLADDERFAESKQFGHDDYHVLITAVKRELDELEQVCGIADVKETKAALEVR